MYLIMLFRKHSISKCLSLNFCNKKIFFFAVLFLLFSCVFSQNVVWDFNYSTFNETQGSLNNTKTHYHRLSAEYNLFNDTNYGKTWIGNDLYIVGKEKDRTNNYLGLGVYAYHDSVSGYFSKNIELDSNSLDTIKLSIKFNKKSKKGKYYIHFQFDSISQYSYCLSPQKKNSDTQWRQGSIPIKSHPKTENVKITLAYKACQKRGTSNWLYIDNIMFFEKKEKTIR